MDTPTINLPPVPPPPPPPSLNVTGGAAAKRHQRRVTLNLIRHAKACPPKLRKVLDHLDEVYWDLTALDQKEIEVIYGTDLVALGDKAKSEFSADLETIRDLLRDPNPENPEGWCLLCGHHHIRWEFDLINHAGGRSTKTGSTCIVTYGLNVDGYGTEEAALEALKAAINAAKRRAMREDWQAAHPTHAQDIEKLEQLSTWMVLNYQLSPFQLYQHTHADWKRRNEIFRRQSRSIVKYYLTHGFLSPRRTARMYGGEAITSILQTGADMQAELHAARMKIVGIGDYWDQLMARHGGTMSADEISLVQTLKRYGRDPENLYPTDRARVDAIVKRRKK
jgi:hypothetical protein